MSWARNVYVCFLKTYPSIALGMFIVALGGCGIETPLAPGGRPGSQQSAADSARQVEFTGTITALSGKAPGATLVVAGRTVQTNVNTLVRRRGDPVGFDRLAVGQVVEVDGTPQSDGSVLATRITIEEEANVPPLPPAGVEVRFEGTLTAISGNTASGTLTVAGRTVLTNASTDFRRDGSGTSHVTFDALGVGQRLDVRGRQGNGDPIQAERVTIKN